MRLTPWLPWLLVTSSACRKIEPVPEELDELVHYLWTEMASGEEEQILAHLLQNVWFAALVGWTGGLHEAEVVVEHVHLATHLLLKGLASG